MSLTINLIRFENPTDGFELCKDVSMENKVKQRVYACNPWEWVTTAPEGLNAPNVLWIGDLPDELYELALSVNTYVCKTVFGNGLREDPIICCALRGYIRKEDTLEQAIETRKRLQQMQLDHEDVSGNIFVTDDKQISFFSLYEYRDEKEVARQAEAPGYLAVSLKVVDELYDFVDNNFLLGGKI